MPTDANGCQRMPTDAKYAKEKAKEKAKENNPPSPPLGWAGEALREAFGEWLAYKAERKEPYLPIGLKNLEAEVRGNAAKYGETAVVALIRQCMASGWRGIIFERLAQGKVATEAAGTATSQWAKDTIARMMADADSGRTENE